VADTLSLWIPVPPRSPNNPIPTTRGRMAHVKAERERAYVCAVAARNGPGGRTFPGPARIEVTLYLCRKRDPYTNLTSLKATVDGICKALLPQGDGPETTYTWVPPIQVQVKHKAEQGIRITITDLENSSGQ